MASSKVEASCIELALEGERLCKGGDCLTGVQFFEAAVQVGTDDLKTLSAIYSQLGNAYFYLQEYGRAMEYHRHDLTLARTIGDRLGEAKASGNLGNTLKVLSKFDEAVVCCQRHLDLSRELTDKVGEARALYNLGNVYHAKGKHSTYGGHLDPGDFPDELKESLLKATEYYKDNLHLVKELGDRAAQGRACGNLGNTHYLLGNFSRAIMYHEERLAIAKEFGDKSAERRAYSNLGNAHVFLGEFEIAAEYYKKTLQIARQLGDLAVEAQACYSLGNTYTLLREYEKAVEYHLKHLRIAQQLADRVGEGRACWSLSNAHIALGNNEKALQFAHLHLDISREVGDKTGEITAQMNLTDLQAVLGLPKDDQNSLSNHGLNSPGSDSNQGPRRRRPSMELMELMPMSPDKFADQDTENNIEAAMAEARNKVKPGKKAKHRGGSGKDKSAARKVSSTSATSSSSASSNSSVVSLRDTEQIKLHVQTENISPDLMNDDESFFDLLSRFQGNRMDEQRCSFHEGESNNNQKSNAKEKASHKEELMDKIATFQRTRMNEQRASMPPELPGLKADNPAVLHQLVSTTTASVPDDDFFEMLMRCQGSRLDDQRSAPPANLAKRAPTVPDEDFFSLIQRFQSKRLEEQRSQLPSRKSNTKGPRPHNK